jgi:hypothetical protein
MRMKSFLREEKVLIDFFDLQETSRHSMRGSFKNRDLSLSPQKDVE